VLSVGIVFGVLIVAMTVRTHRIGARRRSRAAVVAADARARQQRQVAGRLAARKLPKRTQLLPRCPECARVFEEVETLRGHLVDDHL
jgi:hypothetical protein